MDTLSVKNTSSVMWISFETMWYPALDGSGDMLTADEAFKS